MSIKKKLKDYLFLKRCIGCETKAVLDDYGFCDNCFQHLIFIENPAQSEIHHIFRYEGCIKNIISEFKYGKKRFYGKKMAKMVAAYLKQNRVGDFDFIIPVPLHWTKEFMRGFNQSAIVSVYLGRLLYKKTLLNVLLKARSTKSQTLIEGKERKLNVKNSFKVKNSHLIKKRKILLLDDVYTTGATAYEAKKQLLSAGAQKVIILTVAKA